MLQDSDLDSFLKNEEDAPVAPKAATQGFTAPTINEGSITPEIARAFRIAAREYDVDENVLIGIAAKESAFDPDVITGKRKSKAGAIGLMQFMPDTAKRFGIDPTDPIEAIVGAAAYLRSNLNKFGGDYRKAIAGYNWGENRKEYDAPDWEDRLPAETKDYLGYVSQYLGQEAERNPKQELPAGVKPSEAGAGRGFVNPPMADEADLSKPFIGFQGPTGGKRGATPVKKSGSVMDGVQIPETAFDPQEAERLSNRAYAEGTPIPGNLNDPRLKAPSMRESRVVQDPNAVWGESFQNSSLPVRAAMKAASGAAEGVGGVARAVGEIAGIDTLAKAGRATAEGAGRFQEGMGKNGPIAGFGPNSPLPYLADMGEGAAASMAQSLVSGLGLGRAAVIPALSIITAGQEYNKAREAGLDPAMALAGAIPKGAFEAIGEKFSGLDKAIGAIGVLVNRGASDAAKRTAADVLVRSGIREVPGEIITYLGQTATDLLPGIGLNQNLTMGQFLDGLRDVVVQSAMMGGAMGGAGIIKGGGLRRPTPAPSADQMARDAGFLVAEPTTKTSAEKIADISKAETIDEVAAKALEVVNTPVASAASVTTAPDLAPTVDAITALENTNVSPSGDSGVVAAGAPASQADQSGPGVGAAGLAVPDTRGSGSVDTATADSSVPASGTVPQPGGESSPAVEPSKVWYGRRGDGYLTPEDAQRGLGERQRLQGQFDWRIEPTPDGKYRLAGYAPSAATGTVQASAPAYQAVNQSPITFRQGKGGSWFVGGDPATIRDLLRANGITNFLPTKDGAQLPANTDPEVIGAIRMMAEDFKNLSIQELKNEIRQRMGMTKPPKEPKQTRPFRDFLRSVGIRSDIAGDVVGESNRMRANQILPMTFRRNGLNLDALAERALEMGFLTQQDIDNPNDNGGVNRLVEMIKAESRGVRQAPIDEQTSVDAEQAQAEKELTASLDKLGVPASSYADLSVPQMNSMLNRIERRLRDARLRKQQLDVAEESRLEREAIQMADQITLADVSALERRSEMREASLEQFMRALLFTEQEIQDELAKQANQAQSDQAPAGDAATGPQGSAEADSGNTDRASQAGPAGEVDLFGAAPNASQQEANRIRQEREDRERAQQQSAPSPDEFALSGSDRAADVGAASGQGDLLAPTEKENPASLSTSDGRGKETGKSGQVAAPKPESETRFEAGKALTKEQRKQVLGTLVDVYKTKGADREMKGVDRNGNERYGYVHSPDLFEKSDITGAMVRYYVTLPDGRKAHPTEIFPNYTQADIDAEMSARQSRKEQLASNVKRATAPEQQFDTIRDAVAWWDERSRNSISPITGKPTIYPSDERRPLTNGDKFIMVPIDTSGELLEAFADAGWRIHRGGVQPAPTATKDAQQAEVPALAGIRGLDQQGAASERARKAREAGTSWAVGIPGKLPEYEAPTRASAEAFITPSMRKLGFVAYPMAQAAPSEPMQEGKAEPSPKAKIDDFGEKLTGARKDYAATLKDAEGVDVATEPLSKSWPEPDYDKLLAGGADPFVVAFVHAARDEIPTKPQKSWKLKGWVESVQALRDMATRLLDGSISRDKLEDRLSRPAFDVLRRNVGSRSELYQLIGHGKSLKGITFAKNHYSLYKGQENVTKWVVEQKAKATAFSNWPRELAVGDTKEEMLENFKAKFTSMDTSPSAKGQAQFVIYRKRNEPGVAFVGKKIGREYIDLHKAESVSAARKYLQENTAELEKTLEAYKTTPLERKPDNQPRVGDDHRNGAPVTPAIFAETFGFRGVQFGNYVEQGRRQSDLNEAYDGLMDMAAVLGIPPKALSLNGKLGLAFGARGKGGRGAPAAHYEPGTIVINLTKGGGPGSLAHEWWHALDNYFGNESGSGGYGTGTVLGDKTRAEMRAAFEAVKTATQAKTLRRRAQELDKRKSKPYWDTPIELSARSFESYIIAKLEDQGAANDYLANVVDKAFWDAQEALRAGLLSEAKQPETFPYPIADEMPAVRAAFDDFFKTVQTREDDAGNVAMFSRGPFYSSLRQSIEKINAKAMPPGLWKDGIRGLLNKGAVKADEVEWSGLNEWLGLQSGKVTKDDVLAFLDANGVQVQEVVLGSKAGIVDSARASVVRSDDLGYDSTEQAMSALRRDFNRTADADEVLDAYDLEPEDRTNIKAWLEENDLAADKTKYNQYTLPGGTNYREVLLTLPTPADDRMPAAKRIGDAMARLREEAAPGVDYMRTPEYQALQKQMRALNDAPDPRANAYQSSHWGGTLNVIAHIRLNDRTDADGKRVLFVEEVQSDWGQEGKKKGFGLAPVRYTVRDRNGNIRGDFTTRAEAEEYIADPPIGMRGLIDGNSRVIEAPNIMPGIPLAPFVTATDKWLTLALKRIMVMAAQEGYDRVAFINGEQSAQRYDLSKQVEAIDWIRRKDGTYDIAAFPKHGGQAINKDRLSVGEVADMIGKELADRITKEPGQALPLDWADATGTLKGLDLKVGGEGMKAFYDTILPNTLKPLLKKVGGGQLETVKPSQRVVVAPYGEYWVVHDTKNDTYFRGYNTSQPWANGAEKAKIYLSETSAKAAAGEINADDNQVADQPGFTITPEMRERLVGGMPLFRAQGQTGGMSVEAARKIIDNKVAKWTNGPRVVVVATPKDLPMEAPDDANGVYHQGTVYIVAGAHRGPGQVLRTLAHEAVAHYGLRGMLGDGYKKFLAQMQMAIKMGNKPLIAIRDDVRSRYDGLTELQEADEIAARAIEMGLDENGEFKTGFGWLKSWFAKIAQFLRTELNILIPVTNLELQGMLVNAQRFVQGRTAEAAQGDAVPAMSRTGTINVDGVERSRTNSQGQPIHPTEEGIRNFWRWFKDSKVVDDQGRPLVVYHGTTGDLTAFDLAFSGSDGVAYDQPAIFATDDALVASDYARNKRNRNIADAGRKFQRFKNENPGVYDEEYERLFEAYKAAGRKEGWDLGVGANVLPVYLSIQNPQTVDGGGQRFMQVLPDAVKQAAAKKVDGAIVRSVIDNASPVSEYPVSVYIAFRPNQIKSAIGNTGAFNAGNDDIAFSRGQPGLFDSGQWDVPETGRVDAIIQKFQDGRIDLKRAQDAIIESGKTIDEKFDARLAETLYAGRVAHRSENFIKGEVKELLERMARLNVPMTDLSDFLLARHAPERNKQIAKVNPDMPDGGAGSNSKGELMTTQAAKDYIAALPSETKLKMTTLAALVDKITKGTRELLVAEGLESRDSIQAWEGAYSNYVPLFKDEAQGVSHPIGQGMSVRGSASRRATGSTGEVTNMLAHVLMQREAAITRAEKNRVGLALYGLALSHPNKDFWTTIKPNMSEEAISEELEAMGVDLNEASQGMSYAPTIRDVDSKTGQVVSRPNPLYKNLPGAMVVRVNGEDRVLMFNQENERGLRLAQNLKNLDGLDIANETLQKIVGTPTRWIASVNTQYNPAFGLVNVTRDALGAMVNLSSTQIAGKQLQVAGHVPSAMAGIFQHMRGDMDGEWAKLYEQFQMDGGKTGFKEMFRTADERTKALQDAIDKVDRSKLDPREIAGGLLSILDGFNTISENIVRLSAYKVALDSGLSRAESARLARELTVDFNRKGSHGTTMGMLYAFFNASVQGSARTIKAIQGPAGKSIILGGLALGAMQALMLAAAGYDDDEIPEWVKARGLVIPLGKDDQGQKKHAIIPLPLGLHVLPNTGRALTELALYGKRDMGTKIVNAVGEIAGAFNPMGGANILTADGALKTILPTIFDPLTELATNTNFSGRKIEKDYRETDNRPGFQRARENTIRTASGQAYISVSKAMNTLTGGTDYQRGLASPSPEQIRYVAQVVGGGLLREVEKVANMAMPTASQRDIKVTGIPLAGRFYGVADDEQTQSSRYYKNAKDIDKIESSLGAAKKAGDREAVAEMSKDPLAALVHYNNTVGARLSRLNKMAVQTVNDRARTIQIDRDRTELMRSLNNEVIRMEEKADGPNLAQRMRR